MVNQGIADMMAEEMMSRDKGQQDFSQYVEYILKERSPKETRDKFWAWSDIEGALSNLSEEQIKRVINRLAIVDRLNMINMPPSEFKMDNLIEYWQMVQKATIKSHRSLQGFERKMQATQIKEVSAISRDNSSGGLFGGIRRLFGR